LGIGLGVRLGNDPQRTATATGRGRVITRATVPWHHNKSPWRFSSTEGNFCFNKLIIKVLM